MRRFRGYRVPAAGEVDAFVARGLVEWLGDTPFFFVRMRHPKPHLRLRVDATRARSVEARAPNEVARATYRPDARRMGGARAIAASHALECAASRATCDLLGRGIRPAVAASLASAILLAPWRAWVDAHATLGAMSRGLLDAIGVPDDRRERLSDAIARADERTAARMASALRTAASGDVPSESPALAALAAAAATFANDVAWMPPSRRARVAARHVHLLHNRFGIEGVDELASLTRVRRAVGEASAPASVHASSEGRAC